MSAVCRIIHLHGGPSDGLCLAWNPGADEPAVIPARAGVALTEYDYIYVPRPVGKASALMLHPLALSQATRSREFWPRLWSAWRTWLLAPCSYPLDTRLYQIPASTTDSSSKSRS